MHMEWLDIFCIYVQFRSNKNGAHTRSHTHKQPETSVIFSLIMQSIHLLLNLRTKNFFEKREEQSKAKKGEAEKNTTIELNQKIQI